MSDDDYVSSPLEQSESEYSEGFSSDEDDLPRSRQSRNAVPFRSSRRRASTSPQLHHITPEAPDRNQRTRRPTYNGQVLTGTRNLRLTLKKKEPSLTGADVEGLSDSEEEAAAAASPTGPDDDEWREDEDDENAPSDDDFIADEEEDDEWSEDDYAPRRRRTARVVPQRNSRKRPRVSYAESDDSFSSDFEESPPRPRRPQRKKPAPTRTSQRRAHAVEPSVEERAPQRMSERQRRSTRIMQEANGLAEASEETAPPPPPPPPPPPKKSTIAELTPIQKKVSAVARPKLPAEVVNVSGYADKDVCQLCFGGDSDAGNEIAYCDGCDMPVHQLCYEVPVLPEGDWFCRRCEMERAAQPVHSLEDFLQSVKTARATQDTHGSDAEKDYGSSRDLTKRGDFLVIMSFFNKFRASIGIIGPILLEIRNCFRDRVYSLVFIDVMIKLMRGLGRINTKVPVIYAREKCWRRQSSQFKINDKSSVASSHLNESRDNWGKNVIRFLKNVDMQSDPAALLWQIDWSHEPSGDLPREDDATFEDLEWETQLSVIRAICDWQFELNGSLLKDVRENWSEEDLRDGPIGKDAAGGIYWFFDDEDTFFVYREYEGQCDEICVEFDELERLCGTCGVSKAARELQMWKTLKSHVVPFIELKEKTREQAEKQQARSLRTLASSGLDLSAIIFDQPRRQRKAVDYSYREYEDNISSTIRNLNTAEKRSERRSSRFQDEESSAQQSVSRRERLERRKRGSDVDEGDRSEESASVHTEADGSDFEDQSNDGEISKPVSDVDSDYSENDEYESEAMRANRFGRESRTFSDTTNQSEGPRGAMPKSAELGTSARTLAMEIETTSPDPSSQKRTSRHDDSDIETGDAVGSSEGERHSENHKEGDGIRVELDSAKHDEQDSQHSGTESESDRSNAARVSIANLM